MDYTNFNIKKVLPNLFIGDGKTKLFQDKLIDLNIYYVININNTIDPTNLISYNISVNSNVDFIDSSYPINIDFDNTNDFIINALQNNKNILICDSNYFIPFMITCGFFIKYLNMGLTDSIYYLSKKLNIDNIPKNIYFKIFNYFQKI